MATTMSERLDKLIVNYLAEITQVIRESDIDPALISEEQKIRLWGVLAQQLRIPTEYVVEYWATKTAAERARLWMGVLDRRIQNLAANNAFQVNTAERVTGKALDKLEAMLDGNLIRNPGELLAIARLRTGPSPATVIHNNFGGAMLAPGQTLPGNEGVIMLDLSPQVTANIQRPQTAAETRVIDAEMIGVKDLRELAIPPREKGEENGHHE